MCAYNYNTIKLQKETSSFILITFQVQASRVKCFNEKLIVSFIANFNVRDETVSLTAPLVIIYDLCDSVRALFNGAVVYSVDKYCSFWYLIIIHIMCACNLHMAFIENQFY